MRVRRQTIAVTTLLAGVLIACAFVLAAPSVAQLAHHPFAVGANEGAVGAQSGLGAWILAQESRFYLGLTGAVQAVKTSPAGLGLLVGLSFAYGVFHAAGPGHGKAVITSYLVSNEVALRRGFLVSLCAALLQGIVATSLVGIAAVLFNATAPTMTSAAQLIELASYLAIVALGLMLVWRKGWALVATLRPARAAPAPLAFGATGPASALAGVTLPTASRSRFFADDGGGAANNDIMTHPANCDCGYAHMPDPSLFAQRRFDWKAGGIAILTAGARPCSGAILVLVFALSQGIFYAGVAATFAMALGTAVTTGALATLAVFVKDLAVRLSGKDTGLALLAGRTVEFVAALAVLLFGAALLAASLASGHTVA